MFGLVFSDPPRQSASAPERMDVVCVVGLVGLRERVPLGYARALVAWQRETGWSAFLPRAATAVLEVEGVDTTQEVATADVLRAGVPLLFEDWGTFDRVVAWEVRPDTSSVPTATGLAVRAFFANGGARCLVVPAGPALPLAPPPPPETMTTRACGRR